MYEIEERRLLILYFYYFSFAYSIYIYSIYLIKGNYNKKMEVLITKT